MNSLAPFLSYQKLYIELNQLPNYNNHSNFGYPEGG